MKAEERRFKLIEICEVRKPERMFGDGSRGCAVYACDGKTRMVIEVGGGMKNGPMGSALICLCRKHGLKIKEAAGKWR